MKSFWTVWAVLLFSVFALGVVRIAPTTSIQKEVADTVSHIQVRQLMFDGYTGHLWVQYQPTHHTRCDLKEIAAAGFTGVVVAPHSMQIVRKDSEGLNLHVTTHHAADRVRADRFWDTIIMANHRYLTDGIRDVEFDSWDTLKSGIDNQCDLSLRLEGDKLVFHNDEPVPFYDHYTVFISQNANHLMPIIDLAPGTDSLDLSHFALPSGSYGLVVKVVGKPLVRNAVSNVVMYQRK